MKSVIANTICDIADAIDLQNCDSCNCNCNSCNCEPTTQLKNIATQFNQIVVADQNQIVGLLQEALADQICAAYQYWAAMHMTRGTGKVDVDPQFQQHAKEQWQHADDLIERIKQLGGFPYTDLKGVFSVCKSHASCGSQTHNVCDLLKITIQAQKDAIQCYKKIVAASQGVDPTTHKLAKSILSDQEQHLYDLQMLLEDVCDCDQEKVKTIVLSKQIEKIASELNSLCDQDEEEK